MEELPIDEMRPFDGYIDEEHREDANSQYAEYTAKGGENATHAAALRETRLKHFG